MNAERPALRAGLLTALSLAAGVAGAASWEVVVRDRDRQVEIDRATIIQSDGGTKVAWGRIALSEEEARSAGYTTIKALNRYDCLNRSFYTVKRVYLDRRNIVLREESVVDQSPVPVVRNTVDDRLWREVCRPPSVSELRKVAQEAGGSAAAAREAAPPGRAEHNPAAAARPADLRRTEPPARTASGADAARTPTPAATPMPRVRPALAGPVTDTAGPAATATAAASGPKLASASSRNPGSPQIALPPSGGNVEDVPGGRPGPASGAKTGLAAKTPAGTGRGSSGGAGSAAGAKGGSEVSRAAPPATRASAGQRSVASAPTPLGEVRWSYEGDTGPEHWGRLRPDWALCGQGRQQSPIDLIDGIPVDLEPLRVDYRPTRFRITDVGHTLQVAVGEGMGVEIRGQRYELTHIEFHRPAETRIGGRSYDMAAHLHHRSPDGRVAIVAVMLERGEAPHPLVQALWNNLPLERGGAYMPAVAVDPATLMPPSPAHYLYMGSLTTPPCTEGVLWAVMKEPAQLSDEQLRIFARLYPHNGRPVQAANGRVVLESR